MHGSELVQVNVIEFEEQLQVSPLTVAIYPSREFVYFGGGVDEGKGCAERKRLHAMLLVGSGREDGHEYWLLRNSHGPHYGEAGHYKLRKDSNCLADFGRGFTLKSLRVGTQDKPPIMTTGAGEPAYQFYVNPNYDWRLLARRYKQHQGPPSVPAPTNSTMTTTRRRKRRWLRSSNKSSGCTSNKMSSSLRSTKPKVDFDRIQKKVAQVTLGRSDELSTCLSRFSFLPIFSVSNLSLGAGIG